jgi:hypothetical protein
VVCLVTDIYFPKSDVVTSDAGRDLVGLVKRHHPRIPVIIASKTEEASALERSGLVLPKGDPGFLNLLRDYIRDRTGMADFVIYDETGEEWYRLKDLRDIEQLLARAGRHDSEAERLRRVLTAYGEQDRFSSWFYMHGLRRLADRLRPERLAGEQLVAVLKQQLARERGRMRRMPLVLDGNRILDLPALLAAVRAARHEEIQAAADRDDISCWLDQQGYCELAEELRPVHGRGAEFRRAIAGVVEKWITIYDRRAVPRSG